MANPRWTYDRKEAKRSLGIVGVDEAGRGCLAGSVVAGAVVLPAEFFLKAANRQACSEMNDSKQFAEVRREELYAVILGLAERGELFWASGEASIEEIETENIVGATCLAMKRAMDGASEKSKQLWTPEPKSEEDLFSHIGSSMDEKYWAVRVDGRPMKRLPYEHQGLVKGDTISLAIAMGSLIAKVTRDRRMRKFAEEFPAYDFASNKGYGSPNHLKALKESGPTRLHRPRFLRNLLPGAEQPKQDDPQSQLSFE
jgi:ribonuclease HII